MAKDILLNDERAEIMSTLTDEQKLFLDNYVKRGKKTKFANVIARNMQVPFFDDDLSDQEFEALGLEWILIDVKDAGENWNVTKELKCECGRTLRYQYIVKNTVTQDILKFGNDHFEEHTKISESIVREIKNGFKVIDYELDELLSKIRDGWIFSLTIPDGLEIPSDIGDQLKLNLPLLDRQEIKLKSFIFNFIEQQEREGIISNQQHDERHSSVDVETDNENTYSNYYQESIFDEPKNTTILEFSLTDVQKEKVMDLLENGYQSIRVICEVLINDGYVSNERYITRKPRIYPVICLFIESLVKQVRAEFISKEINDCKVQVVN